ncbi:hypothetical protein BD289DRAFT_370488 [Coniella lustricola]|uniref:Glucose-methanol-choline oxidoreductase N-terminal domain-containing protein n=1 Tax=Coniella lustricola TaxID=2025994 RepID=A0A2T3A595_9PEZI|nr:hypothetical protein BD289DRAFT_370488 [Coniella lustricola]
MFLPRWTSRLVPILLPSVAFTIQPAGASTADATLPRPALGVPANATFDYVVIGGGTAGLVVAARLAEANRSVAVIEAGGFYPVDDGNFSTVPSYAVFGAGSSAEAIIPSVDWGFMTTAQAGLNNRSMHYARGKTLGGSSARNYFTYNRPTVDSMNQWATAVGDESYSWDNFWPYFQKSVNYTGPDNEARPANASIPEPAAGSFTAGAGPLRVSFPTWANAFSSWANLGWQALGLNGTTDFVSGTLTGVQYCQNTINPDGQIRSTSYSSFLTSAADAGAPIHVFNNTLAQRILFNGTAATGVAVSSSQGAQYVLSAAKEVILSAGALQSPQLLLLSGVGPAKILDQFDIEVVSELPGVGANLQDHIVVGTTYQVNTLTHSAVGNNLTFLYESEDQWNLNGGGILGNPGGELIAWERLEPGNFSAATNEVLASAAADAPTLEYLILDAYSGNNQDYETGAPDTPYMYASPVAALHVPQSRGFVTIASTDASVAPVVNPNWLTSPVDQELALFAFRRLRQMMDTTVMQPSWVSEVVPGRNVTTDAQILNVLRQNAIQEFHASATCKMGVETDADAVVNSRGQVFGTENLRVVDLSAVPFLPGGHPQGLIYALAEKITDDILRSSW